MHSSESCPFGSEYQKYWDRRHQLFSKFDDGIQLDIEALFSVTPEKTALEHAKILKDKIILDAFGCVSGNSIAFAQFCKKVYMIEINKDRLEMGQHNAGIYGVKDKIHFIHGDYFDKARDIDADVVYLDPPRGGPSYSSMDKFCLNNFSPDGSKILDLAFDTFSEVMIKLPKKFDLDQFQKRQRDFDLIEDYVDGRLTTKTAYFR